MAQTLPQPIAPELIARISLDQYHRMVEAGIWDDRHVELLNGIIVEMSPEGIPHASKRTKAQEYLAKLLGEAAQLRIAAPITLPEGSEPEPDIAVVHRQDDEYDQHHPYPHDIFWLIEYSNTSLEKDSGMKAEIYAKANIPEYWIVDLRASKLIVLREPVNGTYQSQQEMTTGTIQPPSLR